MSVEHATLPVSDPEMTHQLLLTWLEHRRTSWPHTPNRHVLVNERTALGTGPISPNYLHQHLLRHGVRLDRIRADRVLHEGGRRDTEERGNGLSGGGLLDRGLPAGQRLW
ncbi:hypothetical protein [Frankia sp. EAN1pec]|uniref:hypothetical protein n=1 Tax=Parafrankia sp. (strain EAN1pec) TaxID=298653 RepID=UPI0000541550